MIQTREMILERFMKEVAKREQKKLTARFMVSAYSQEVEYPDDRREKFAVLLMQTGHSAKKAAKMAGFGKDKALQLRRKAGVPCNHPEYQTAVSRIDDEKAEVLYNLGLSDRQIASDLGCGKSSVQRWRSRMGIPPHTAPRPPKSNMDVKEARRLWNEGVPIAKMATTLHVGKTTIRRWLQKEGLSRYKKETPQTESNETAKV